MEVTRARKGAKVYIALRTYFFIMHQQWRSSCSAAKDFSHHSFRSTKLSCKERAKTNAAKAKAVSSTSGFSRQSTIAVVMVFPLARLVLVLHEEKRDRRRKRSLLLYLSALRKGMRGQKGGKTDIRETLIFQERLRNRPLKTMLINTSQCLASPSSISEI